MLGLGLFFGEKFLARGPYPIDHIWRAYPKIRDFAKYENRWGGSIIMLKSENKAHNHFLQNN